MLLVNTFIKMVNDSMDSSQLPEVHVVQKPNTSSIIWNYFGVKVNGADVLIPNELEISCVKSLSLQND